MPKQNYFSLFQIPLTFSKNSMHLLKVDESKMDNSFETTANITLYDVSQLKLNKIFQQQFESSFTCCDSNDQDWIVVGNEDGEIGLATIQSLISNQKIILHKISDQSLTFAQFSSENENIVVVGTNDAQIIVLNLQGQIIYKYQCKKVNGGKTSINSLAFNPKVSRIVVSACQQSIQVHDTAKHTAIQSFMSTDTVISTIFSQTVATNIYVLTANQLQLFDLKDKKQAKLTLNHAVTDATYIQYIEGIEGIIGIFSVSGKTVYVKAATLEIVGQQQLGQISSYAYPNLFVSTVNDELQLSIHCYVIQNTPILFNIKLLNNIPLNEDEDDLFDCQQLYKQCDVSSTNQFYYLHQNQLFKHQINDSDKLVNIANQIIQNQVQIENQDVKQLIQYLSQNKQDLLENIIQSVKDEQNVTLTLSQSDNKQQTKQENYQEQEQEQNDEDFFNNLGDDDFKQSESYSSVIDEQIEDSQQNQVEELNVDQYTDINQYLLNGQYEDAINIVLNQKRYDLFLQLIELLPFSDEAVQKYYDIYNQRNQQYKQVLQIAQLIQNNQFDQLNCSFAQKLKLAKQQNQDIFKLSQKLLESEKSIQAQVPLLILTNNQQKAIELVLDKANPSITQKIQIEIELHKLNYSFYKQSIEQFIKTLKSGGNTELSEQLVKLTGIKQELQQPQQPQQFQQQINSIQTTRKSTSRYATKQQQIQQPQQINQQQQPFIPDQIPLQQPQQDIFNVGIQNPFTQQPQNQTMPIPQQQIPNNVLQPENNQINILNNSSFSANGNILNTSVGSISNNENIFQVVDLSGNNGQQQFQQQQQQFQQQQPLSQQQQQPIKQDDLFIPLQQPQQQYNNMQQQYNMPPLPPTQQNNNQFSPLLQPSQQVVQQPQGIPIVAQLPPSVGNQQSQLQQIQVTHTTAPQRMQVFAEPVQRLNTQLKSLDLVNSVVLKTNISQQVKQIAQQFYEKSHLDFQKNAKKIAELLIYLSDYQEVNNLLTQQAVQTVEQYVNNMQSGDKVQAKKLISDFSLQSSDLAQFAGILKIMAK